MADRNNQNFNRIRRALNLSDDDVYNIMVAAGQDVTRSHVNGWHVKAEGETDDGHGLPNNIMTDQEFDAFCLGVELKHRQG